ncbi:hypothetical protein HJFPF1_13130 [Paramyrothecium foliicola]|nr:hypothetical protein HJFPF1_13130 [Paramyrothecium foliicola]
MAEFAKPSFGGESSGQLYFSPDDIRGSRSTSTSFNSSPVSPVGCLTRRISDSIDSCDKAHIVATMALDLLAFDGKLHATRSNWACPFADCKESFMDSKALMQHVASCPHFTTRDRVYCNRCRSYDCFASAMRHDRNLTCTTRRQPKRATRIRKLTNYFTRSRSGSNELSRSSGVAGNLPSSLDLQNIRPHIQTVPQSFEGTFDSIITNPIFCEEMSVPPKIVHPIRELDAEVQIELDSKVQISTAWDMVRPQHLHPVQNWHELDSPERPIPYPCNDEGQDKFETDFATYMENQSGKSSPMTDNGTGPDWDIRLGDSSTTLAQASQIDVSTANSFQHIIPLQAQKQRRGCVLIGNPSPPRRGGPNLGNVDALSAPSLDLMAFPQNASQQQAHSPKFLEESPSSAYPTSGKSYTSSSSLNTWTTQPSSVASPTQPTECPTDSSRSSPIGPRALKSNGQTYTQLDIEDITLAFTGSMNVLLVLKADESLNTRPAI